MTAEIRCLTVRQPFASLILDGIKPIECRSWPTDYRGLLAIHSAASKASLTLDSRAWLDETVELLEARGQDDQAAALEAWLDRNWPDGRPWKGDGLGRVLGVVQLTACEPAGQDFSHAGDPWWPDAGYAWRVTSPVRLPRSVVCNGKLSLWKPPQEAVVEIASILPADQVA